MPLPWTRIGLGIEIIGIGLTAGIANGFGEGQSCGDWGLGCFIGACLAFVLTQATAMTALWLGVRSKMSGTLERSLAIFFAGAATVAAVGALAVLWLF